MGDQRTLALEIRTITVTTRAAVRRHGQAGRADLVPITIERGMLLLDELRARRPADGADSRYEEARRSLEALRKSGDAAPALSRPE